MKRNFPKKLGNNQSVYYVLMLLGILFMGSLLYVLLNKRGSFEPFDNSAQSGNSASASSASSSKVTIEYYYMETCPYCVEFNTVWDEVTKNKAKYNLNNVQFEKYEIAKNQSRAKKFNINSAPTVIAVDKQSDAIVSKFIDARDVEFFVKYASTYNN